MIVLKSAFSSEERDAARAAGARWFIKKKCRMCGVPIVAGISKEGEADAWDPLCPLHSGRVADDWNERGITWPGLGPRLSV